MSSTLCTAVDNGGNALLYKVAVTNQLLWDSNSSLPLVLADSTNDYINGPTGEPVEMVNTTSSPPANNPQFMTFTPSDSSWLLTNAIGTQTSFTRYDAFGNLTVGTPGSPFGYAGQYLDTGTGGSGFSNMRARWYDGQTGSFTTRDPAFSQTNQAFAYAGGDPVNQSDPSGRCVLGFLGNCGPTDGATISGSWVTVPIRGPFATASPHSSIVVYLPFYNDVNQGVNLWSSLNDLWYGLYQHGDSSTVNSDGQLRLSEYQNTAALFEPNSNGCTGGDYGSQFACAVSGVLASYQTASGSPGLGAFEDFIQTGERSLAYLVYANSENQTLTEVYGAAADLFQKLYTRDIQGKNLSFNNCSEGGQGTMV